MLTWIGEKRTCRKEGGGEKRREGRMYLGVVFRSNQEPGRGKGELEVPLPVYQGDIESS